MKNIRKILLILLASISVLCAQAQNELIISQYIHNRYAINPSFAGNREGLTIFGSFRKQWTNIENTPQSILLTTHAPLRNENIIIGLSAYNQSIHESTNTGALFTIGYRARVSEKSWLSFALQPGVSLRNTDWKKVKLIDSNDDAFRKSESSVSPLLGFGLSWYGRNHFIGASVVSLMVSDDFDQRDAEFAPADANYILTGGYMFGVSEQLKIQPSVMASFCKKTDTSVDGTITAIYKDFIWIDAGYRTTDEITLGAAVQIKPQLRVAYNYDYMIGDLNGYQKGSHEISIQYDFVYKVKTVGPKFF